MQVTKVRISCLKGATYHARIHFVDSRREPDGSFHELDIDARPSDALNMAARFAAPIYVNKQVAEKMVVQPEQYRSATTQTTSETIRSCKDVLMHFSDPTVVDKLHLQLAIKEERYDDALV